MNDFDVDKPLPSVIAIKCAENHLYRIGLSLFPVGSQKRKKFHNPFFIFFNYFCLNSEGINFNAYERR